MRLGPDDLRTEPTCRRCWPSVPDSSDEPQDFSHVGTQTATGVSAVDDVVEDDEVAGVKAVAGRTPWQLARIRLRRDKPTMVMIVTVAFALVMAVVAPILDKLGVLDPQTFHSDLINGASGGLPIGPFGGISWSHPLGVEPGT